MDPTEMFDELSLMYWQLEPNEMQQVRDIVLARGRGLIERRTARE